MERSRKTLGADGSSFVDSSLIDYGVVGTMSANKSQLVQKQTTVSLGNNLLSCAGRARGAIEWVRGARLRPYLARLNAEEGAGFEGGNPRESPEGLSADGRRPRDLCASGASPLPPSGDAPLYARNLI